MPNRLLGVALMAGLIGAGSFLSPAIQTDNTLRMPSSAASNTISSSLKNEARLTQLFNSYYRISACRSARFSAHAAGRTQIDSQIKRLSLGASNALEFTLNYLLSANDSMGSRAHIGPTCIPDLRSIQSTKFWIRDLKGMLSSSASHLATDSVAQVFPTIIVNILEDQSGNIRSIQADDREEFIELFRTFFGRINNNALLDIRNNRPLSPEFALQWASRLGDIKAFDTVRSYLIENMLTASASENELGEIRRSMGLKLLAEFNPGSNRRLNKYRTTALVELGCLKNQTGFVKNVIESELQVKLPSDCKVHPEQSTKNS